MKSSGKAAGSKKKAPDSDKKTAATKDEKVKVRDRDKKNIGKRRAPSDKPQVPVNDLGDGFSTFKMKPQ